MTLTVLSDMSGSQLARLRDERDSLRCDDVVEVKEQGSPLAFCILGSVEVISGGQPVPLRAAKERSLLAALVLRANQVVSRDRLYEVLWGETPPATSAMTLNTYISHLRSALEPDRARRGVAPVLITREPGYLLAVDPDDVDALRFERLVSEGLQAVAAGDAAGGAATLETALGLWRGQALADVFYEAFAQADVARLQELHLLAMEELTEAKLALGHHAELVGRLRQLVVEQPLRERPWGQLMLALYRCGRQGEALRAYNDLRRVLADELGIGPSPALQRLEDRILLQKPELDWSPAVSSAESQTTVDPVGFNVPASLPAPLCAISAISRTSRALWPAPREFYEEALQIARAGRRRPPRPWCCAISAQCSWTRLSSTQPVTDWKRRWGRRSRTHATFQTARNA